jgi:hypothetical protein
MIYQGYDLVPFRNGGLFYVAICSRAWPPRTAHDSHSALPRPSVNWCLPVPRRPARWAEPALRLRGGKMRSVQFRFLSTRDASFSHFAAMSLSRAFARSSGAVLARFSQSARIPSRPRPKLRS